MEQPLLNDACEDGAALDVEKGEKPTLNLPRASAAEDEMAVYTDKVAGVSVGRVSRAMKCISLSSRPGYSEALASRRRFRHLLLPAIGLACLSIHAGEPGDMVEVVKGQEHWVFLGLLVAAIAPWCFCNIFLQDMVAISAALLHTWHGIVTSGGKSAHTSEFLVLFWVVVLPVLAGTQWNAVLLYICALCILLVLTEGATIGISCLVVGVIILVPVLVIEIQAAKLWDELRRYREGVQSLLSCMGDTCCTVDVLTGHIIEASAELEQAVGCAPLSGRHVSTLVQLPHDQLSMTQLLRTASLASAVVTPRNKDKSGSTQSILEPVLVESLRTKSTPSGSVARIVPYEVSQADRRIRLWFEVADGHSTKDAQFLLREQALCLSEERRAAREREVTSREARISVMEETLTQMHGLYDQGRREQLQGTVERLRSDDNLKDMIEVNETHVERFVEPRESPDAEDRSRLNSTELGRQVDLPPEMFVSFAQEPSAPAVENPSERHVFREGAIVSRRVDPKRSGQRQSNEVRQVDLPPEMFVSFAQEPSAAPVENPNERHVPQVDLPPDMFFSFAPESFVPPAEKPSEAQESSTDASKKKKQSKKGKKSTS